MLILAVILLMKVKMSITEKRYSVVINSQRGPSKGSELSTIQAKKNHRITVSYSLVEKLSPLFEMPSFPYVCAIALAPLLGTKQKGAESNATESQKRRW